MNDTLQHAIETLTANLSLSDLGKARNSLTTKYRNRSEKTSQFMQSDLERLSYLVTRMPATYAVVEEVLNQVRSRNPAFQPTSMLDLGSGPGTAYFAAISVFPELKNACLIEQDVGLIKLGKSLEAICRLDVSTNWKINDITNLKELETADLITISYAINELDKQKRELLIEQAWHAANKILVIIEPGTMEGFSNIREARAQLLALGGNIVAPCPHGLKCPMPENDWCHFSKRVSRTSAHRQLKQGSLGHEDEKFSYIAIGKPTVELPNARIIRHPEKHSGHINFKLCTKDEGLKAKTISKRDGDLYKQARKQGWGDSLP